VTSAGKLRLPRFDGRGLRLDLLMPPPSAVSFIYSKELDGYDQFKTEITNHSHNFSLFHAKHLFARKIIQD